MIEKKNPSLLPLWLFPINSPLKKISPAEEKIANLLTPIRAYQYKLARGYARFALSKFLQINALDIPLDALPGKAPKLNNNLGYISLSHCKDALLIGWSTAKVGIDIERSDRQLAASQLANRFFTKEELQRLKQFESSKLNSKVLENWVLKEAVIKWQRGQISKDCSYWNINQESSIASHEKLNYKVNICLRHYQSWLIGIAYSDLVHKDQIRIYSN